MKFLLLFLLRAHLHGAPEIEVPVPLGLADPDGMHVESVVNPFAEAVTEKKVAALVTLPTQVAYRYSKKH